MRARHVGSALRLSIARPRWSRASETLPEGMGMEGAAIAAAAVQ